MKRKKTTLKANKHKTPCPPSFTHTFSGPVIKKKTVWKMLALTCIVVHVSHFSTVLKLKMLKTKLSSLCTAPLVQILFDFGQPRLDWLLTLQY